MIKEADVIPIEPVRRIEGEIVKLFVDESKGGYGFIKSRDKPYTRIFFHYSGLLPTTKDFLQLHKGDRVIFDLVRYEDRGWRAIKIEVIP